ncbi:MAG: YHS domain-containing protein [Chloroflexota bacterium]|nr:YHS domain-containing protein [Chloroflexota bacterium]
MATVKDPVCGMEFDSSQAEAQTTYEGQAYFFCSEDCRRTFEQNPKEFIADTDSAPGISAEP